MAAVAVLNATTKLVRIKLAEGSTTASTVLVNYLLKTVSANSYPYPELTALNTTTSYKTIAVPASSGDTWVIASIFISNNDNITHIYTVEYYDGTNYVLLSSPITILAGKAQTIAVGGGGSSSAGGGGYYQTLQINNSDKTQRTKLDLIEGTGIGLTFSDDSGNDRSKVTVGITGSFGANLRISGSSSDPWGDCTAATHVYIHPVDDGKVDVLISGVRTPRILSAYLDINISAFTANKPYDIFVIDDGAGGLTYSTLVWTNDTTRATAIAWNTTLNWFVKSGDTDKRYIGTIYIDSGGGAVSSNTGVRNIWNATNQRQMKIDAYIGTRGATGYTTTSATYVDVNSNTTLGQGKAGWVQGLPLSMAAIDWAIPDYGGPYQAGCGIALDGAAPVAQSVIWSSSTVSITTRVGITLKVLAPTSVGYHTIQKKFVNFASGTTTLYDNGFDGFVWG